MTDEEIDELRLSAARLYIISNDMSVEAMVARRNWYEANKRLEAEYEDRRIEDEVQLRLDHALSAGS